MSHKKPDHPRVPQREPEEAMMIDHPPACPKCGRKDIAYVYKMDDANVPRVDSCMACNPDISAFRCTLDGKDIGSVHLHE